MPWRLVFLSTILMLSSCSRDTPNPIVTQTSTGGPSLKNEHAPTAKDLLPLYDAQPVTFEETRTDGNFAPHQLATYIEQAQTNEAHGNLAQSLQDWQRTRELVEHLCGENSWQSTNVRMASKNAEWKANLNPQQQVLLQKIQRLEAAAHEQPQTLSASDLWQQARSLAEQLWGNNSLAVATYLSQEALAHQTTGNNATAVRRYRSALEIREQVMGREHPDYAATLDALAQVHFVAGKHDIAREYLKEATRLSQVIWGSEHLRYALHLNELGMMHHRLGDMVPAEHTLLGAFQILKQQPDNMRVLLANTAYNLGAVYFARKDFQQTCEYYDFALKIYTTEFGRKDLRSLRTMESLSAGYLAQDDFPAAEILLREIAVTRTQFLGQHHPDTLRTFFRLAVVLGKQGNYEDAEPYFKFVLQTQQSDENTNSALLRKTLLTYATLLQKTGQIQAANSMISQANALE